MIVIGVPTTGAIPTRVVGSIENVLLNRPNVTTCYIEGSLVYDARARIVNYALQKGADLLFVDSDIEFGLDAFDRLVWRDTDIVSGLYYGRHEGHNGPIAYKSIQPKTLFKKAGYEQITEIKPYMEVAGVGLGFCLIKNKVLKSFNSDKENPFEPFGGLGEDFSFFLRCKKKGYKCMLDTTFTLNHLGEYAYSAKDYQGGQG